MLTAFPSDCRLTILRLKKAPSPGIVSCQHMSKGKRRRTRNTSSSCSQLIPMRSLHSRFPTMKLIEGTACFLTGKLPRSAHFQNSTHVSAAHVLTTRLASHLLAHCVVTATDGVCAAAYATTGRSSSRCTCQQCIYTLPAIAPLTATCPQKQLCSCWWHICPQQS